MIGALGLALVIAGARPCVVLEADVITGADLAAADAAFAAVPASRVIGYAPYPGRQRSFSASELAAIAESAGLKLSPAAGVCFEWRTSLVTADAAQAAMSEAFPDAGIEVAEISRYPAPPGKLVFPRAGLQRLPAAVMLWRGYVEYGQSRKFDVWARAKVTVETDRVIATEMLRAGQLIREDQVRVEKYSGPPLEPGFARSAAEVVGRVPRSLTVAESPVRLANLEMPVDIARGDVVTVEVVNGAARIVLEARAASSGRLGSRVQLQNQNSGRMFRATVTGTGHAVLVIGEAN